ncbi:hypothetical protein AKO1_014962 [Acrasis kona]|uniref:MYND-type domain-containing protein n=1 Tax=Acrasis kona TaxID=1008807 RepID=A0AAW2Z277_9EUKA
MQCGRCRDVDYCGRECQIKDWKSHKTTCVPKKEVPASVKSFEPKNTSEYKLKSYWDSRFKEEEQFDWLGKYEDIREPLSAILTDKSLKIMVLGCGNSTLSNDLHQDGYTNVISMDYSSVVIDKMSKKYPHLEWVVMDVCDMSVITTGSYDIVLDKGVMDALVTDEKDPWNPSPSAIQCTRKMCKEVCRVLKKDGHFIQISFDQPHFRRLFIIPENEDDEQQVKSLTVPKQISASCNCIGWNFEWRQLTSVGFGYFMYVMKKE